MFPDGGRLSHTQTVHPENTCFPYKNTLVPKDLWTPNKTQCLPSVYSYLESLFLPAPFLVLSPSKFPEGMWVSALSHIHQHFFGLQSASLENCRGCLLSALVTPLLYWKEWTGWGTWPSQEKPLHVSSNPGSRFTLKEIRSSLALLWRAGDRFSLWALCESVFVAMCVDFKSCWTLSTIFLLLTVKGRICSKLAGFHLTWLRTRFLTEVILMNLACSPTLSNSGYGHPWLVPRVLKCNRTLQASKVTHTLWDKLCTQIYFTEFNLNFPKTLTLVKLVFIFIIDLYNARISHWLE